MIKLALSDPGRPVYWEYIGPLYAEINAIRKEMFIKSKRLAGALHSKWQGTKELWRIGQITWRQYEEERSQLEVQAWKALEALKEKYDKAFSDLEERIKARLRARRP